MSRCSGSARTNQAVPLKYPLSEALTQIMKRRREVPRLSGKTAYFAKAAVELLLQFGAVTVEKVGWGQRTCHCGYRDRERVHRSH
jgi:hypothetical protein